MTTTSTTHSGSPQAEFDFAAFFAALDDQRREQQLDWYQLAAQLWQQSSDLNTARDDHPLCGGAVSRLGRRGETSCQYAMFMLRWLDRAPEDFVTGQAADGAGVGIGTTRLPAADPGHRLRWDLHELHAAIDARRRSEKLTWPELGHVLLCTPGRLTHLKTARHCDLALAVRAAHWVGTPTTAFIHAAAW